MNKERQVARRVGMFVVAGLIVIGRHRLFYWR